jgi:uncharacterized protein YqhQ
VGGQALIEGVMMRSKTRVSVALRRKSGEIETRIDPHTPYRERAFFLKWPVCRGAATLFESLVLGMRYLSYSADKAVEDEKGGKKEKTFKDAVLSFLSIALALAIGVGLFMYVPTLLADAIKKDQNPALFNLMAGGIRIAFFLAYVWGISKMKDIRRVFQYHGAEHKSIFAFESGGPVTVENARKYSTHHARCGTSFLLIAGLACILIFSVIDFLVTARFGPYPTTLHRLGVHFALIPLVSGISYEILRWSDKMRHRAVMGRLILPGLWLQRITTREPDDGQLEVAIVALKGVL